MRHLIDHELYGIFVIQEHEGVFIIPRRPAALKQGLRVEQAFPVPFQTGGVPGQVNQELFEYLSGIGACGLLSLCTPLLEKRLCLRRRDERRLIGDVVLDK